MTFTLPIRLVSESNLHEHWRIRQRRAKSHRFAVAMATRVSLAGLLDRTSRLRVTITRVAPRALDSDNLVGSGKHARDGVADALGINDRDPRVTWVVAQTRGGPGEYAIRIDVESEPEAT